MKRRLVLFLTLFFVGIGIATAQTPVRGIVVDESGEPVIGATIQIKGTSEGTVTDIDGNFSLSAPANGTLVVSYVGYETQEVAVSANVRVILSADTQALDEVIVIGYGTQRRREFTGAAASVRGASIADRPLQSFGQGLVGQAAGVSITQPNGLLNNPPVIRIRGLSSLSLSSFPLVVVDGIPITTSDISENSAANNPLSDINPSDIESIDILKDAASAAIYGSRAAAGVLIITTKKGREGKAMFSYDGWVGVNKAVRLPELLNAQQYMDHKNAAILNARSLGSTIAENAFQPSYNADGSIVDTKWYDYVYRSAFSHNHNFSVSGGTAATRYYFSAGYSDQEGFLRGNDFERKTARMNIDHDVTKWFKVSANVTYTNGINNSPNSGSIPGAAFNSSGLARIALVQAPNLAPYNEDGSYNVVGSAIGNGNNALPHGYANPVPIIDLDRNSSETSRLIANLTGELFIYDGLSFRTIYSWDRGNTENLRFWNPVQGDGYSYNGYAYNNNARRENWNLINTLNYSKTFLGVHNFSAVVGHDAQNRKTLNWGAVRQDLTDDFFDKFQGTFRINQAGGNGVSEIAFESYLANLSYNYAGKYFISGNIRRDGNSALSENNRWGTFGGVSAGWTISEEGFFTDLKDTFSLLRLRASYGEVGNGNLNNFYGAYNNYSMNLLGPGTSALLYSQAGNQDLKWETSAQTNIGIDVSLFHNRVSFELNYYNKDVDNLILEVPQAPSKGIPSDPVNTILLNVGSLYNRGFEFTATAVPVETPDFRWTTNFNITTNKNRVTSLGVDDSPLLGTTGSLELTSITQVGSPAASLYVVKTDGINPENGRRIFINAAGERVQYQHLGGANAWTYLDGTRAPAVSGADAQIGENTLPTWYGGFNNTLEYKGFDLGLNFTFSGGNYIYNGTKAGLRDQRIWNNATEVLDAWTETNTNGKIPRAIYGDNVSNGSSFAISENVEKGDFLRLQTVTLGYSLPSRWLGNSGISRVRVYTQVNNAFIITSYTGADPEISTNGNENLTSGIERNSLPQGRTFTFGLNVNF